MKSLHVSSPKPHPSFAWGGLRCILLVGACLVLTCLLAPRTVHAKVPVSIDADYAEPLMQGDDTVGYGGNLRFGPRLDLKIITLDSEIVAGMHFFDGTSSPNVYQGMLGPRLGILWGLRPSVFGHMGVGHVVLRDAVNRTGLTGDLGVALDLTVLPLFDIGAHSAWNFVAGNSSWDGYSFVTIGAHLTFVGTED